MGLLTTGRLQKARLKPATLTVKAKAVVDAVAKVMKEELSPSACERWRLCLNTELGMETFVAFEAGSESDSPQPSVPSVPNVPNVWVPSKPKLTIALLDQLEQDIDNALEQDLTLEEILSPSAHPLRKLIARLAVDRMRTAKDESWLAACGELSDAQLKDDAKLTQVLSKASFSLIVFVHASANRIVKEEGLDCFIDLHSSNKSLGGKALRGCGIVYCETGGEVVKRALQLVRAGLTT